MLWKEEERVEERTKPYLCVSEVKPASGSDRVSVPVCAGFEVFLFCVVLVLIARWNRYPIASPFEIGMDRNQSHLHLKSGGRLNLGLIINPYGRRSIVGFKEKS